VIDAGVLKGFLVFAVGSLLGSFLNVLIYRLPREKSIVWPGSKCPKCNTAIAGYDNVPVLSWLILGGKCRSCKEKINIRYPLIELLTATLLFLTYRNFGIDWKWCFLTYFVAVLIVIAFIDLDYMLILDCLTYPAIILGFIYSFINNNILQSILGAFGGAVFFYLIVKVSLFLMKKEGMGLGDVTLVTLIGAWLGLEYLLGTVIISFLLGSVIGVFLLIKKGKSEYFPFGPALTIGAVITLLTNNYLLNWYLDKFI
jgi:leader peptidase (prepilin peptidase)/N-methyltransferase